MTYPFLQPQKENEREKLGQPVDLEEEGRDRERKKKREGGPSKGGGRHSRCRASVRESVLRRLLLGRRALVPLSQGDTRVPALGRIALAAEVLALDIPEPLAVVEAERGREREREKRERGCTEIGPTR